MTYIPTTHINPKQIATDSEVKSIINKAFTRIKKDGKVNRDGRPARNDKRV